MNEIIMPNELTLKAMTTAELWAEFKTVWGQTASNLARLAVLWCELRERGEDLTPLQNPLTSFLPDVAEGRLSPRALLLFNGRYALIQAVQQMVVEDQEALATMPAVPVLQLDGSVVKVRPSALSVAQARQVLSPQGIRTPAQQKRHMAPAPVARTKAPATPAPRPEDDAEDFSDELSVLTEVLGLTTGQVKDLVENAEASGRAIAAYVLDVLIEAGAVRDRPGRSARQAVREEARL